MVESNAWTGGMEVRAWNAGIVEEFRAGGGRVGGRLRGRPLLLLHTVGARTGRARVTPLMYLADRGRYLVFASSGGSPRHPAWYRNLRAEPAVTVEVRGPSGGLVTFPAVATELTGPERDARYARQVALYPGFGEYERIAGRTIPVIALVRH